MGIRILAGRPSGRAESLGAYRLTVGLMIEVDEGDGLIDSRALRCDLLGHPLDRGPGAQRGFDERLAVVRALTSRSAILLLGTELSSVRPGLVNSIAA